MNPRSTTMLPALLASVLVSTASAPIVRAASGESPPIAFPVVFFPPDPPVYGSRIDEHAHRSRWVYYGHRLEPPEGLAAYVGDILYPPLSTRLYAKTLGRALEERVEKNCTRRNALVNALLERLMLLGDAADDVRERELRVFAGGQTSLIVALELEAEELRQQLTRRLLSNLDWNANRRWTLESFPAQRQWANLEAEFQVVRAAAYYQDGLTPAQRGLLRELAMELGPPARRARGDPVGRSDSDAMFFSPETTRLRLPPNLSPELIRRVAGYNALKHTLKRQLREMIHKQEGADREDRTAAFTRLAEDQWPHFGTLEGLAEEIRTDLARHFVPNPPAKPPAIPGWLIDLINPYNAERNAFLDEMQAAINAAAVRVPRPQRESESDDDVVLEQAYLAHRAEAQRRAARDFEEENAERLADLQARSVAIRRALETIARTITDPKTGRPINVETLLHQHAATMDEFERYGRATALYANYRTAMLQRGLSPEQRRLLFSHAIVSLAQPLPPGEPIPNRRARYPMPR